MKELVRQVRSEREDLTLQCYEELGWQIVDRSKANDTSPVTKMIFVRVEEELSTEAEKRTRCEEVLERIEAIDAKAERYYLERVVLVGLAGAACIGFSFLFLHLGWHILFTLSLLAGLFGCSITLALRPPFIRMGLKRFGEEIPHLEEKLHAILTEKED